jgi:adenylylsulfate kinase
MHETRPRSIAKALTWRVIATLTTASIAYIFSDLDTAIKVGAFDVVIKLAFYYLHERGWGMVEWGFGNGSPQRG